MSTPDGEKQTPDDVVQALTPSAASIPRSTRERDESGFGFGPVTASTNCDDHQDPSFRSDDPHVNFRNIRRSITLRPSSSDLSGSLLRAGFPSLTTARDDVADNLPDPSLAAPGAAPRGDARGRPPPNAPQLRIRPILKRELELPSPLARRGAAEREYLQGQLKAEALRRRRREQHNEQRKLRWNADEVPAGDRAGGGGRDGDVLSMVERLRFGFRGAPAEGKGTPQSSAGGHDMGGLSLSASPPAILKTTFKRSVSAVLADSGIDEDDNLLFFPDGVPLLRDEEEGPPDESADSTAGDCGILNGGGSDDGESEGGSMAWGSVTLEDNSPSLIPADVIWQLGVGLDNMGEFPLPVAKANKKVTLRPKMIAPDGKGSKSHPNSQFKPMDGSDGSHVPLKGAKDRFKFETPEKLYPGRDEDDILAASESFRRISFKDNGETKTRECENSSNKWGCSCPEGGNKDKQRSHHAFSFSSPEAGSNCKERTPTHAKDASGPSPAPLSEFSEPNYFTPDNSGRFSRKQLGKMPKVPELLCMPGVANVNPQQIRIQGRATIPCKSSAKEGEVISPEIAAIPIPLKEPLSESNFCTPDNSYNGVALRRQSSKQMPQLPEFQVSDAGPHALDACEGTGALSPEAIGVSLLLRKPVLESDFRTPDDSVQERRATRRHPGEQLPKLPEFSVSDTDAELTRVRTAMDAVVEEKKEISPEIEAYEFTACKEALLESHFRTPDDRVDPFRIQFGARIPKLPEFGLPDVGSEGRPLLVRYGAGEEEEVLTHENEVRAGVPLRKEPFLESNFKTPDHPLDHFGQLLDEPIPKVPTISLVDSSKKVSLNEF